MFLYNVSLQSNNYTAYAVVAETDNTFLLVIIYYDVLHYFETAGNFFEKVI